MTGSQEREVEVERGRERGGKGERVTLCVSFYLLTLLIVIYGYKYAILLYVS